MKKTGFALFLLFAGLIFLSGSAYAQSNIPQGPTDAQMQASGIVFPVAELGGCADKAACKRYCDDPSHAEACIAFAEKRGLMNKEEAEQAKKFSQALAKGGPGGCRSSRECETFCSDINNLEACVSFAKQQGIKSKDLEQGEKVLKHIKAGGKTPGGCASEQACKEYCSDFTHAEECYNFAKSAGIIQVKGSGNHGSRGPGGDDLSPEQFQKVMELAKSGQTPGGCTSKESCEAYCSDSSHFDECTTFAEKAGFMSKEEAAKIRKTGGKGPGGCSSPRECESFCNSPANREVCFKFAEEHGLISEQDKKHMQEGLVHMRAGIEQAPPEVAACLKSKLGNNIIDDIQSGRLMPGPDIGGRMRECFDKFGHRGGPHDMFQNAPPEVMACFKEKIGDKFEAVKSGKEMPTPETADALRVCFQAQQFEKGGFFGGSDGQGPNGGPGGPAMGGSRSQEFQRFLRTAPPQVASCFKEKLGGNFEKLQNGEPVDNFDPSLMRSCFESFRPQEHFRPQDGEGGRGGFPGGPGVGPNSLPSGQTGIPREVLACVKERAGADITEERIRNAGAQDSLGQMIRECFGKMQPPGQGRPDSGQFQNQQGPRPESFPQGGFGPASAGGLPEPVVACVKEKAGGAVDEAKLRRGERPGPEVEKIIAECFTNAAGERPQGEGQKLPFPGDIRFASGTSPAQFRPGQPGREFRPQLPSGTAPAQFRGEMNVQFNEQMKQGFNQQYNAEFQRQYEEKFRSEMQRQMGDQFKGMPGPSGDQPGFPPGIGHMQPPMGGPGGQSQPPMGGPGPGGNIPPLPGSGGPGPGGPGGPPPGGAGGPPPPPPPQSLNFQPSLLGTILAPFVNFLGGGR